MNSGSGLPRIVVPVVLGAPLGCYWSLAACVAAVCGPAVQSLWSSCRKLVYLGLRFFAQSAAAPGVEPISQRLAEYRLRRTQ